MKAAIQTMDGAVLALDGRWITLADLPPPNATHWVPRRKAEVVAAVRGGLLSLSEACARYALSVEEFVSWQRNVELYGLPGLRASHRELADDRRRHARMAHAQHLC